MCYVKKLSAIFTENIHYTLGGRIAEKENSSALGKE